MVNYELDSSFNALSDPTRRDILQRLTHEVFTVGEIAKAYNMSLPAVSKHLKVLLAAELITKERRGRQQVVRIAPSVLRDVTAHLLHYEMLLNNRLHSLGDFLQEKTSAPRIVPKPKPKNAEQALVVTRTFDVGRDEVWRAYTDPKQITQWWAPKGGVLVACESDARVGGRWRFVLYDGSQEYVFSGIFHEVEAPQRLVYTDGYGEPDQPRPEAKVTVSFEELPGGRTKLTKTTIATPAVHQFQAALMASIEKALA